MKSTPDDAIAEPLLAFDRKARELFLPYRHSAPVRVLETLSHLADQPQLRLLCGGLFALGLVRSDTRMMGAAARMLIAHEVANTAKNHVKRRIDRRRPRSARGPEPAKLKKGGNLAKEMTSFPSGHSGGGMAVACAFAGQYPQYRVPAIATAGGLALSRIPSCAHYPSDVAAGLALGVAANALVAGAWRAAAMLWRRARA